MAEREGLFKTRHITFVGSLGGSRLALLFYGIGTEKNGSGIIEVVFGRSRMHPWTEGFVADVRREVVVTEPGKMVDAVSWYEAFHRPHPS